MAKYNETIVKQIVTELEEGMTQKDTARLVGIGETTFYEWFNKKPKFRESVELAESKYIKKMTKVVNVKSTTETTGRLALDILARRRFSDWGERKQIEGELNINVIIDESLKKKE